MVKHRPAATSRRRPKRTRTATTLYSDDNPSTFTVKRKKGEAPEPVSTPKPSFYYVEEDSPPKRTYIRKKDKATAAPVLPTLDPTQPPVKRKRGRPPSLKTRLERERKAMMATKTEPEENVKVDEQAPKAPAAVKASLAVAAKVGTTSWTPPIQDSMGTFLSHAVTVAPILPPTQHDKNPRQRQNAPFERRVIDQPTWTPLYCPDVYFDDDYSSDTNTLDLDTLPVTRSITCVTTRKPDHAYMAVGDSAGFCTIYSMGNHIRPVARLETVACQQRARQEQEKIREQKMRKKKLRTLVMDTSQTTIHALGMIASRVVLATACELECMDVPSQTSLWVCPLSTDRIVTSLDMHLATYDVLVSCSLYQQDTVAATTTSVNDSIAPSSPLMLVQHSQNKVEICDANSPILVKSPCCTAIWDSSKSVENRLLFVALSDDQELELVLVQGGSIDNWKVACKTRIPVKASNHDTKLCQSPEGIYTLVACSRGIRLYHTETLQLINVYGDQLSLHGKSVVWQDCLLFGNTPSSKRLKTRGKTLECDDWLVSSTEEDNGDDRNDLGQYVVGIPNFKGPKELCETLHVWHVEKASTVPALSIPLPAKSEGVQGVVGAPGGIVMAGRDGEGHALLPNVQSNFAGIMYPPGYQVITDNLEYVEDEDELDTLIDEPEPEEEEEEEVDVLGEIDEEVDEDIKEAMRQSLLEQKLMKQQQAMKDVDVEILDTNSPESFESIIPCRPEAYLRQEVNKHTDDEEDDDVDLDGSTNDAEDLQTERPPPQSEFLPLLQSMPNAYKPKPKISDDGITFTTKAVVLTTNPIPNKPGRGRKSRAAILEATLKASINRHVQSYMISKQSVWADGSGSTQLRKVDDEKVLKATGLGQLKDPIVAAEQNPKEVTPSSSTSNDAEMPPEDEIASEKDSSVTPRFVTSNGDQNSTLALLTKNIRPDEAAVALGLLGLSPCNAIPEPEKPPSQDKASIPIESKLVTGSDIGSFLNESLQRVNLTRPAYEFPSEDAGSPSPTNPTLNHVIYGTAESSHSSDRGSAIADTVSDSATSILVESTNGKQRVGITCFACRGRQVIHSCGKRSLPIDFDEMAKAERERKHKEEEAKKKMRAEKRRLADQRRREAAKQKKLREQEERRRREEEEIRLEKERIRRAEIQESTYETKRREMIVASYANHISQPQWSAQAPVGTTQMDLNAQRDLYADSRKETVLWGKDALMKNNGDYAKSGSPMALEARANLTDNPKHQQPESSPATYKERLSSADALVALANFAGATAEKPESTRLDQPARNAAASYPYVTDKSVSHSYGAVHGFSSDVPTTTNSEPGKRSAIPSYASLREQVNGDSSAIKSFASSIIESNGIHGTRATSNHVWAPQREAEREPVYNRSYTNGSDTVYQTGDGEKGKWPESSN